jgi:hypothetical protein
MLGAIFQQLVENYATRHAASDLSQVSARSFAAGRPFAREEQIVSYDAHPTAQAICICIWANLSMPAVSMRSTEGSAFFTALCLGERNDLLSRCTIAVALS